DPCAEPRQRRPEGLGSGEAGVERPARAAEIVSAKDPEILRRRVEKIVYTGKKLPLGSDLPSRIERDERVPRDATAGIGIVFIAARVLPARRDDADADRKRPPLPVGAHP